MTHCGRSKIETADACAPGFRQSGPNQIATQSLIARFSPTSCPTSRALTANFHLQAAPLFEQQQQPQQMQLRLRLRLTKSEGWRGTGCRLKSSGEPTAATDPKPPSGAAPTAI